MAWQRRWMGRGRGTGQQLRTQAPRSLSGASKGQGTPQLHQSPAASPQAGNARPACARAGASSLGLSSAHRNTPMSALGIKRKKGTLRTGADSSGSGTGDPNRRGDRIREQLPWRIGSSCRQKAWSKKWKARCLSLSQREPKESSHDLLKEGCRKRKWIRTVTGLFSEEKCFHAILALIALIANISNSSTKITG